MDERQPTVCLRYYGISPWEIEVVYNLFNEKFEITQEETEQTEVNFVSALTIIIPLSFSEEFFKWFEFRAWENVKHIIKEMKRRRGKGNAIIVEILFTGDPNVRFVTDLSENHNFNSAIEKIDFVVELLPYHLNDDNIPNGLSEVVYKYDIESGKWRLNSVLAGQKKFIFTEKGWKIIT
jgi:sulfur relay (sulfurtransferase) DsrC/TusE family protein